MERQKSTLPARPAAYRQGDWGVQESRENIQASLRSPINSRRNGLRLSCRRALRLQLPHTSPAQLLADRPSSQHGNNLRQQEEHCG